MKKHLIFAILLTGVLSTGCLVHAEGGSDEIYTDGDAVEITKEGLVTKIEDALENVSSVKSELVMKMNVNVSVAGNEAATGMQMNMIMEALMEEQQIFEPYTSHRSEKISVEFMGQSDARFSESYLREEDGELIEYSGTNTDGEISDWSKKVSDENGKPMIENGLESFGVTSTMTLLGQKVKDNSGDEFYVLKNSIELDPNDSNNEFSAEITKLLDEIKNSFSGGDLELPDTVVMNLYVSTNDYLPKELLMDLSGISGTITDSTTNADMKLEFSTLEVSLQYSDYNEIEEIIFPDSLPTFYEMEGNPPDLAKGLGVRGIRTTADTSVSFTDNGTVDNPAGINEMGKAYFYNSSADLYEQAGVKVTKITCGEEAAKFVSDLQNAEDSYYRFFTPNNDEEYRVVEYDMYLPTDLEDTEYGIFSPNCMIEIVGFDGQMLRYKESSYYAVTNTIYHDGEEFHPGDTAHCKTVVVMPTEIDRYLIKFGPYALDNFYVAIK